MDENITSNVLETGQDPAPKKSKRKYQKRAEIEAAAIRKAAQAKAMQAIRDREARAREGEITIDKVRYDSTEDPNEKQVRAIFASVWHVTRKHHQDLCIEWANLAAETLGLTQNIFFWYHGPKKLQESIEQAQGQKTDKPGEKEIVKGEVSYKSELLALYVFVEQWRKDAIPTFEEYLAERREVKVGGTINRGNKYFGKDFHEKPHAKWDDMDVHWNPDLLEPEYTQDQMKKWLGSQSEDKKRVRVACRSSYKSTFTLISLIAAVLCCPDIRILLVSETRPLSKDFIDGFRSFWQVKNRFQPSRFNRLFAEFCVDIEKRTDSLVFESPMAHLDLFQSTAESTSMDSTVAGRRADIIVFDDPCSNLSTGTEEQRKKGVTKYDAIMELLEVSGYAMYNATPWHEEDLTAVILDRNAKAKNRNLLYIIDPCWTVKDEFKSVGIWELEECMVDLLFPARLTWEVLQAKLQDGDRSARTFRMQSLCMFLPEVEDDQKLQFDRESLERCQVEPLQFPAIVDTVYASGDLGFSKSRYADPSAFTVILVAQGKVWAVEQAVGHWRDSEKAQKVVELQRRHPVKRWVIERYPSWERLDEDIRREAMKYGVTVPVFWAQPSTKGDDKFHRVKSMETYIAQDKLKFFKGKFDDLFTELEKLDGTVPAKMGKKDTRADSLSIALQFFMPLDLENDDNAKARQEMQDREEEQRQRQIQHDMIFGPSYMIPPSPKTEAEEYQELSPRIVNENPLMRHLNAGGLVKTNPNKKPMSFSFLKDKPIRGRD